MIRQRYVILLVLILAAAALACSVPGTTPDLTATAFKQLLEASADTPVPEDITTEGGVNGGGTKDGGATVTEPPADAATAEPPPTESPAPADTPLPPAPATDSAELAAVKQELAVYGVNPDEGRLGWLHPPVEISVSGFETYTWDIDLVRPVKDFVIAADITWNTRFGSSGCGYVLRSDGKEEDITQYLTIATRYGQGRILFGTQILGNLVMDDSEDIYANGIDPLFQDANDTMNRVAVVGRGSTFSFYTNGTYLGDFVPENLIERGLVAFVALNQSGSTFCRFENAFLWQLE